MEETQSHSNFTPPLLFSYLNPFFSFFPPPYAEVCEWRMKLYIDNISILLNVWDILLNLYIVKYFESISQYFLKR